MKVFGLTMFYNQCRSGESPVERRVTLPGLENCATRSTIRCCIEGFRARRFPVPIVNAQLQDSLDSIAFRSFRYRGCIFPLAAAKG